MRNSSTQYDLPRILELYDEGLYTEFEVEGITLTCLVDSQLPSELWRTLPLWLQSRVTHTLVRLTARVAYPEDCEEVDDDLVQLLRLRRELEALGKGPLPFSSDD